MAAPRTKRGYYSILQFEPSKYRQERVNIAVLLEGPQDYYRGAKRLRHMEKLLQFIDPSVDIPLVRAFAQEFEAKFKNNELDERVKGQPLLEVSRQPHGLRSWLTKMERYRHFPFRLTEPKPLSFDASLSFDSQLQGLYETMIARPRLDLVPDESKKKAYVRQVATTDLRAHIEVEIDPPEIKGRRFDDHSFDAAQKVDSVRPTYFEFVSFDIAQPNTNGVKLFLQSVEDVIGIEGDEEHPALGEQNFYLIYQDAQPSNAVANKIAQQALHYVRGAGIRAVPLGPKVHELGEYLSHGNQAAD